MKLIILRHGKTAANEEKRYIGRTDQTLSPSGIEEIRQLYPEMPDTDLLFSSPMKRCLESAKLIFGDIEPFVIPEWKEMDFGDFEMKNYSELNGNADYQAWIDSGASIPMPNGESRDDFIKRTMKGYEKFMSVCRDQKAKKAAALVHGGTIMSLLSALSGEEYFSFYTGNGRGFELEIEIKDASLKEYRKFP